MVLVLVAEILARWAEPQHAHVVPGGAVGTGPTGCDPFAPFDRESTVPDLDLLWRNRPSFHRRLPVVPTAPGSDANWDLAIDARGLREWDRRSVAGGNVYRILCLGDSITQGFHVDGDKAWPAALATLLARRHPAASIEVLNAGVPEWTWVQGTAWLLRDGLAMQPDLVIAAFGTSDQSGETHETRMTDSEKIWLLQQPTIRWRERLLGVLRGSALWRLAERRSCEDRRRAAVTPSPGCRLQTADGSACNRVAPGEIASSVRHLAQAAKATGADLLLLNLDFAQTAAAGAVRQTAVRDDLRYLDAVASFRNAGLGDDMRRARDLRLGQPKMPFVPFGRIGLPPPEDRGPRITFRVLADPPKGTLHEGVLHVRGRGPENSGFVFDEVLHDDGMDGDERAGDGVASAVVESLPAIDVLRYRYFAGDTPEFDAPASTLSSNVDRSARFNRDAISPIETWGWRRSMIDELHPDARGHASIAESVASEIEKMPSFRHAAGLPALPPGSGTAAKEPMP